MIAINEKLLGKVATDYIVERGETENGHYEKWNSGIMKQWGKVKVTDELKTAHGSTGFYRPANEQFIIFPVSFVGETPIVTLTAQAALNIAYIVDNMLDSCGFYPLVSASASGATRYVHWQAIGKWK